MAEQEQQYTLLLVDDNPTNLLLLVKIIELDLPEVRVLTAGSGREGLALAECEVIDGAFVDVQMPQMSGLEMCRRLNENPRTAGLPLVLMTAHLASPELRAEGLEVGAYDFISQPISNVEMLARIKVMLRLCANERRRKMQRVERDLGGDRSLKLRWISGLLISEERAGVETDQQLIERLAERMPDPATSDDVQMFDFLSSQLPENWQRTLLKLSLLDQIPLELGLHLSEIKNLESVFGYLQRHDLVNDLSQSKGLELSFKPASRTFLRRRAIRVLDDIVCHQVYLFSADWYQRCGDFIAAIDALLAARQYRDISQMFERFGLSLLDQPDAAGFLQRVASIPDEVAARCGWMALFRGIYELQCLTVDAGVWLELALQLFTSDDDQRGCLLALLYQVYLTLYQDGCYDRWGERQGLLKQLAEKLLSGLDTGERVRVMAACNHADLFFEGSLERIEKDLELALNEAQREQLMLPQLDLNILRVFLGLLRGRRMVTRSALEQGFKLVKESASGIRPAVLQLVACEVLHAEGDLEGLRRQRRCFSSQGQDNRMQGPLESLLDYFEATLLLARGDNSAALELLDIARLDNAVVVNADVQCRLMLLRGLCYAITGEEKKSLECMDEGLQLRHATGGIFPRIEGLLLAGMTCAQLRQHERAVEYLELGLSASRAAGEERYRIGLHAWSAQTCHALGQTADAERHLGGVLDFLRQHKRSYFFGLTQELIRFLTTQITGDNRSVLQPLFADNLFVSLTRGGKTIPLLKVYALGGFQLELGKDMFDFSQVGHALRQIFALLMISPKKMMSIEPLMSQLWPDSPSSKARNSFDANHSRLRKSLEEVFGKQIRRDYLVLEKGMLSLQNIWIDSITTEGLISQAQYALQRGHGWQAENLLWQIDDLWKGEFLAGFDLVDDLLHERDKLNQMRFQQLEWLARQLAERQHWEEAVKLLKLGLSSDPTRGPLVRLLLDIYRQEQNSRAAGQVLDAYREALMREDCSSREIAELIDSLGAQSLTLTPEKAK